LASASLILKLAVAELIEALKPMLAPALESTATEIRRNPENKPNL
jgi:hypothetical protein